MVYNYAHCAKCWSHGSSSTYAPIQQWLGTACEGRAYSEVLHRSQGQAVRVPRQYCDTIRSALTLLLTRKQLVSLGDTLDATTTAQDYYASVVSVHGSARTAKIAVYRKLRELYRIELQESRRRFPDDEKLAKKLCRGLQERLALVQNHLN